MTGFEFFILAAVKAALTGAALVAVSIAFLNWERIVGWLSSRSHLVNQDVDNYGFSLVERINSGNYRTVYGVFNRRTGRVIDGETVQSQGIDLQTEREHAGETLLIY
jgi:hypothetical protein